MVAKGYVQRQGIDFEDVFAPVARMDLVRVLITLVAHHDWQIHHMDIKSAFWNGDLLEELYVQQPLGYVKTRCCASARPCTVCAKLQGRGTRSWMTV